LIGISGPADVTHQVSAEVADGAIQVHRTDAGPVVVAGQARGRDDGGVHRQSPSVTGPGMPWEVLVGEIPYSVPHGASALREPVSTDLKRPDGSAGLSSQYCSGNGPWSEPKNSAE